jgi:hypothetical protein
MKATRVDKEGIQCAQVYAHRRYEFLFSHVYKCTVVISVIDYDGQLEYEPCRKNNIQSGHCIS